jgi:hypothetical protein
MIDFKIKKGNRYCNNFLYCLFKSYYRYKTKITYDVIFTDSCIYNLRSENNLEINELFGLSFGYHKNNSASFGWNCVNGNISLFSSCYSDSKRNYQFITTVVLNKQYKLSIRLVPDSYMFIVIPLDPKKVIKYNRLKRDNFIVKWGYRLWPHFGKSCAAIHDIIIKMKEIKL